MTILHTEKILDNLCDFSISSKASSAKSLLQSHWQMDVTECEIKTVWQFLKMLSPKSFTMALCCSCGAWSCIFIQQHNSTCEKARPFNCLYHFLKAPSLDICWAKAHLPFGKSAIVPSAESMSYNNIWFIDVLSLTTIYSPPPPHPCCINFWKKLKEKLIFGPSVIFQVNIMVT